MAGPEGSREGRSTSLLLLLVVLLRLLTKSEPWGTVAAGQEGAPEAVRDLWSQWPAALGLRRQQMCWGGLAQAAGLDGGWALGVAKGPVVASECLLKSV